MNEYLVFDAEAIVNPLIYPNGKFEGKFPSPYLWRLVSLCGLHLRLESIGVYQAEFVTFTPNGLNGTYKTEMTEKDEKDMLVLFSSFLTSKLGTKGSPPKMALVSYNGRGFDTPLIVGRSMVFGVKCPWYDHKFRYRYSLEKHIDLADVLADYGACSRPTLDHLGKLIGLPGKMGIDGSQVADYYEKGLLKEIDHYCLGDCFILGLVFLKWLYMTTVRMSEQHYLKTVKNVLDAAMGARKNDLQVPFLKEMAEKTDKKYLRMSI